MSLLGNFDYDNSTGSHVYRLNNVDKFLSAITVPFRKCYITDKELEDKSVKSKISKKEMLEKTILPDKGNIRSGDFGEIFGRFLILSYYKGKGYVLFSPKKWLWKEDRNKPSSGTDVVAFYCPDPENSSVEDFIVSLESKMEATPSTTNRIQDAIDGAKRDKLSRLAKTLVWMKEKYTRNGDPDNTKLVERYLTPVEGKTFNKIFKALAILDTKYLDDEISEPLENTEKIIVIIATMENLKSIYEATYKNVIGSV